MPEAARSGSAPEGQSYDEGKEVGQEFEMTYLLHEWETGNPGKVLFSMDPVRYKRLASWFATDGWIFCPNEHPWRMIYKGEAKHISQEEAIMILFQCRPA